MGKALSAPYRRVDPLLTEGVYKQAWQHVVDNKINVNLILLYSWNELEEHAAIEPDTGVSPVSYGSLVEKTGEDMQQFLAGQDIQVYNGP